MSYRDDDDALQLRHDDLVRELAQLESKVADHRRVTDELAAVRQFLTQREARRGPVRLDKLKIASPCKQKWDDMVGDERVRVCAGCERPVFNLSAMTQEDAEAVLATRGVKPCVRFYQRADGTVMTADCPSGKRPKKIGLALAAAALAAGGAAAFAATRADDEAAFRPRAPVMGAIPPPPPPMIEKAGEWEAGEPSMPPEPAHMGVTPVYDEPRDDD